MFRFCENLPHYPIYFPRVSGDVPQIGALTTALGEFSPRERGCSLTQVSHPLNPWIFPA